MIYLNEIDPFCAQWLQNLMDADVIPRGHIDTRSIEDVTPNDLAGYHQCHFFAGLGGWVYALDLAGWPRDRPVWTGSCPCQPFSAAGKGAGFEDERHLWPAWQHLIAQCNPPVVFGEQVASKDADAWIDLVHADMEGMGYAFGSVPFPAAGIGAPHIRDRNYWVGLADPDNARLEGRQGEPERAAECLARTSGLVGGLADANGRNPGAERQQRSGQYGQQPQDGGAVRLADTDCREQQGVAVLRGHECDGPDAGWAQGSSGAAACGDNGGLANATGEGSSHGGARNPQPLTTPIDGSNRAAWPGPTNGHWRVADWLACRDGKWRPVEPGTFPLAHGVSGRVGRLRAYGNAIVPQAAAEFIASYLEATGALFIEQAA